MFLMTSGLNFLCLLILLKVAGPEELEASPLVSVARCWGGETVYWIGDIP